MFNGMYDKTTLPTNIKKIVETNYKMVSYEEDPKPATTMKHGEEILELYLKSKIETDYKDSKNYSEIEFDENGERYSTNSYKYNDLGQMISWKTDMEDSAIAAIMNSNKTYTYDTKGRITSIMKDEQEVGTIKYNLKGGMESLLVDAGFAKMKITASKVDNKTRYDMKIDEGSVPESMLKMFMDKIGDAPKAYIEQMPGDKKNTFTGFEENKETGEFEKRWETVRNLEYKVLSKKEFSPDGEIKTHEEFEYTESGDIKSTKNIIEKTELINEFDDNGNMTLEKQPFGKKIFTYDEKGNLIKTVSLIGEGEDFSVQSISMREIEYK